MMSTKAEEAAEQAWQDERYRKPWLARREAEQSPSRWTRYNPEQLRRAAELEQRTRELVVECGGRCGTGADHDAVYFDGPDGRSNSAEFERRWKKMVGL